MTDRLYSQRFAFDGIFLEPDVPFNRFADIFDPADVDPAHDNDWFTENLLLFSSRTPVVIAFVDRTEPDVIQIVHSPSIYLNSPGNPSHWDDTVMALTGNSERLVSALGLPDNLFARLETTVLQDPAAVVTALRGVAGPPAVAAVPRVGPHAVGDPGTHETFVRCGIVLPVEWAIRALEGPPSLTPIEFHDRFLHDVIGDAARLAVYQSVVDWWVHASTLTAPGAGAANIVNIRRASTGPAGPATVRELNAWVAHRITHDLALIPTTAAGLTAVTNAITTLDTNIQDINTRREAEEAARRNVSFTDRHGTSVATLVQRYCNAAGDDALPEIHRLMASYKDKSRDMTTLNLALHNRASTVPHLNEINVPRATPHLVNLFRSHNLIGAGVELGEGMTPFAVVCYGHPYSKDILELADKQATMEAGNNTVTLSDASRFTTKDVRFPRTINQVLDKLDGFTVILDVYFGQGHTYATATREGRQVLAPHILALETAYSHNPRMGMMLALRILMWVQQATFLWLRKKRVMATGDPTLPDYEGLVDALRMGTHDLHLPRIPEPWMTAVKEQLPELFAEAPRIRGGGGADTRTPRAASSSATKVVNATADPGLKKRYAASGMGRVADLISKIRDEPLPQYNGSEACLSWALKGECTDNCKRKAAHKRYGQDLVQAIHEYMDKAGVAALQE